MLFNVDKCKVMQFGYNSKRTFEMNGNDLQEISEEHLKRISLDICCLYHHINGIALYVFITVVQIETYVACKL
jgi:hypothetical protein